jgi:hypothetical protein
VDRRPLRTSGDLQGAIPSIRRMRSLRAKDPAEEHAEK